MRMRTILGLVLLAGPGVVLGQPGAATAPSASAGGAGEVRALVAHLSDDSYEARQDAQDQLVRYGERAKPVLREFLKKATDPEARTRAESALAQIDENRMTGPSLVTLHVKDAPAGVVLAELARQGMYAIPTMPDNLLGQEPMKSAKVTLDADREPFWVAFRAFCEKTGLRPNSMGNDRKFVLMQGGDESMAGPAVYPGAFMVVANQVTRTSSINLARDKAPNRSMNIQFSVFAEPKLNVMGHDYYLRVTEAVDEKGNSLVVPQPGGFGGSMGQDTSARWSLAASLAMPEGMGTRLARIKGMSRALVQTKSETWEVTELGIVTGQQPAPQPPPTKQIGGRKYVAEEVRAVDGQEGVYQVKFTMMRVGPRAGAAAGEQWDQYGRGVRVTLVDGEGKPLASRGYGGGGSEEKLTYTYTFARDTDGGNKVGVPAKLVVEVPTEVREVEVPFEFKDLPLP